MACNGKACAECTQNCLLIHGKKRDPSSVVTSFFKVMIGENFSDVLYLPPKFVRTMPTMVNQRTHLEDSTGQRWKVTLSNHNESLVFQEGWPAFSRDHGLEVGDFLVFYYIKGSHFVVHIWGKSGCEKFHYSQENDRQKKKIRPNRNLAGQDGGCGMIDKNLMKKKGSRDSIVSGWDMELIQGQPIATENTSTYNGGSGRRLQCVSTAVYKEEPFYMIDRDAGYEQEVDRTCFYDLSRFEMQWSRSDANEIDKVPDRDRQCPHRADTMLKSRTETDLVDVEIKVAPPGEIMKVIEQKQVEMHEDIRSYQELFHGTECGQSSSLALKDNDKVYTLVQIETDYRFDLSKM